VKIGELAHEAGVSTKAVRYYESVGLLFPKRLPNGYRDYGEQDVRLVCEIRDLARVGIRVEAARPFLDCIVAGMARGDDCAPTLVAYREAISSLDDRIDELSNRRATIAALLRDATLRPPPGCELSTV
jgi:DNA-binding transcriptional MerR regulator